jgi:thiazole/oxazole-forming peptide maturase SagD family component
MNIVVSAADLAVAHGTKRHLRRMLGQLTGLQQQISFLLHGRYKPRVVIGGVELTGVHLLQGRPKPPGVSPYHIGGCGLVPDEALIRAVGETLERYSQLVAEYSGRHELIFATHEDIGNRPGRVVATRALQMFSADQLESPGFPFHLVHDDDVLAWVSAESLIDGQPVWVPAQLVLVGYAAKTDRGEKRIAPAVTTGSAAHTDPILAMRNALLETIQLDSSIGHWYSSSPAYRIETDSRTPVISKVIETYFHPLGPEVNFFWLPNPDMPGFSVACLIRERGDCFPKVAIGLGMELNLSKAMYKAMLEAVGVSGLSKVTLLESSIDTDQDAWIEADVGADKIFDLDANILYFGFADKAPLIERKFFNSKAIRASDLPPDIKLNLIDEVRLLVNAFEKTGKELVLLDLTTCDIRELGFSALRVWSPDTLSLSLPSAAPLNHPRFKAYGGAVQNGPHPYA